MGDRAASVEAEVVRLADFVLRVSALQSRYSQGPEAERTPDAERRLQRLDGAATRGRLALLRLSNA